MKVQNIQNNKGKSIPNQYIIEIDDGRKIFQSYDSIIAVKEYGKKTKLYPNWNYSRTTSKCRSIFLNESTKETKKKIENNEYEMIQ